MKFTTKASKADNARSITLEFNTGATVEEKVTMFGADVVNDATDDSIIIKIQSTVRKMMADGKSDADIKTWVAAYKPGTRNARVTVRPMTADEMIASLTANPGSMTPEFKALLLASLQPKAE
jgi:hypothetical protein